MQFRVFGLQRSGNHAVINWIRSALVGDTVFLNQARSGNAIESCTMLEIGDLRFMYNQNITDKAVQHRDRILAAQNVIVSYENKDLKEALEDRDYTYLDFAKGPWTTVCVSRSFFNWSASFYKRHVIQGTPASAHNRTFSFVTGFFERYETYRGQSEGGDVLPIDYDRWLTDTDYRKELLECLGVPGADPGLGQRADMGGGSSFDGRANHIDIAHQQQRWQLLIADTGYLEVIKAACARPGFVRAASAACARDAEIFEALAHARDLPDYQAILKSGPPWRDVATTTQTP